MAQGLFNLTQVNQAVRQGAWANPSSVSTYGAYFGGSGSGQYLTGPTTSALNFSTGSFTVEFWAFLSAYGGGDLTIMFSASNASADFQFGASASSGVYWHNSGNQLTSNATAVPLGKWVHMALVRSGTTASLFCNGVRYSTTTNSAAVNLTNFNIGSYQASPTAYMTKGWISNLRITNTAVYDPTATTLTLPLTSLTAISGTQLLTLQNATIIDNSTNALTITNNGSVGMQIVAPFGLSNLKTSAVDYLVVAGGGGGGLAGGGAGGFLTGQTPVANGSSITVTIGAGGSGGSGSNSVFGSIAATGGGGAGGNPGNGSSGGSGGGTYFGMNNIPGQGTFLQGNAGSQGNTNGGSGGGGGGAGTPATKPILINFGGNGGAGVASAISGALTAYAGGAGGYGSSYGGLGGTGGGGNGPTAGGSGTAGTANTGGGGGGSTGGGGLSGGSGVVILSYPDTFAAASAVTGATVSTSGSGSLFFSGSTKYLTYSANSFNTAGTWTIEAWVYLTSSSNNDYIVNGLGSDRLYIQWAGTNFLVGDAITNNIVVNGNKPLNQWLHVAVVKNGGTYTAYFNGSSIGSSSTALTSTTLTTWQVGARTSNSSYTQGYMSNLRVVTSAVYTANFTVPTSPLTAIANTQLLLNTTSGGFSTDASVNALAATSTSDVSPTWNASSPFAVTGYKNRVYTWTSSGSITF